MTTTALLGERLDRQEEVVATIGSPVVPAVEEVELAHLRLVAEAVVVLVHSHKVVGGVDHERSREARGEAEGEIGVSLDTAIGCGEDIGGDELVGRRLLVLNIYLPREGLVAVDDSPDTLGDLYAVHPGARDIAESVGCGETAEVGDILDEHLDIATGETEHLDSASTRCSVGIVDIDRGVSLEALAEVAAGSLAEFGAIHVDSSQGAEAVDLATDETAADSHLVHDERAEAEDEG